MTISLSSTKTAITVLCLFIVSYSQGQSTKSFSQQLSLITENDRYLMQGRDGYYTNGLMFQYLRTGKAPNQRVLKRVHQFELGQKLFSAYSRKIYDSTQIDRPITGYIYGKYTRSDFKENDQLLQWSASAGAIGKASLGEDMQNTFHKIITVNSNWWGWVWNYQLKTAVGVNLHGLYAKGLLQNSAVAHGSSLVQLTTVSQAVLGTDFTNISQGMLLQLGKINPMHTGTYWNASVDAEETSAMELFFYYHPELMYQFYNSTIQGGLYLKDKGPITSSIEPWVLKQQLGIGFAAKRYNVKLELVFQSREAKSQRHTHSYGGLHVGWRFR